MENPEIRIEPTEYICMLADEGVSMMINEWRARCMNALKEAKENRQPRGQLTRINGLLADATIEDTHLFVVHEEPEDDNSIPVASFEMRREFDEAREELECDSVVIEGPMTVRLKTEETLRLINTLQDPFRRAVILTTAFRDWRREMKIASVGKKQGVIRSKRKYLEPKLAALQKLVTDTLGNNGSRA